MFRLYEDLPDSVAVGGTMYHLNLDFANVLLAFDALQDKEMTSHDRLETALMLMAGEDLPDLEDWPDLWDAITGVLRAEDVHAVEYDQNGDPMPQHIQQRKPDFDFGQDAQLIYAAFWQTYGLDLFEQRGQMHWYKFQSLLAGLPDDTKFSRVRQIRGTKLSDIKDKKERAEMAKLKREVALVAVEDGEEEGGDAYGS
ncbi:Gp15 family bacteriophage protein [Lacticaseibacillus absianus]|uniref:Gp15 family bacteriophage protein n=1 Tax=Lacticaseibacillus absianus TaxID=2729623 RepID=UPI0015CCBEBD|nr:Gp15 family bacteriophage protein [Lacticaseibacillus absianus]